MKQQETAAESHPNSEPSDKSERLTGPAYNTPQSLPRTKSKEQRATRFCKNTRERTPPPSMRRNAAHYGIFFTVGFRIISPFLGKRNARTFTCSQLVISSGIDLRVLQRCREREGARERGSRPANLSGAPGDTQAPRPGADGGHAHGTARGCQEPPSGRVASSPWGPRSQALSQPHVFASQACRLPEHRPPPALVEPGSQERTLDRPLLCPELQTPVGITEHSLL